MRYESLLAGRYIKAQKRQSLFTRLSIAVTVATLTVIFVLYGVYMDNARRVAYQQRPYHLVLYGWPENKATALRSAEHVQSVSFEPMGRGKLVARVLFDGNIGSTEGWLDRLTDQLGEQWDPDLLSTDWNEDLIELDRIDDDSVFSGVILFFGLLIFALLFAFFLRLVVDTAFEISSKEREQHYGLLQSVGATPKQIVGIITREGLRLCLVGIPLGIGLGLLLAYGMYRRILEAGFSQVYQVAENTLAFSVDPLLVLLAAGIGVFWTFFSAYGVGMRVVKRTPIQAITGRTDRVKKVKRRSFSGLLFGLSGHLASRNVRRQKKRFRITVLGLTISITLFAVFSPLADTVERVLLLRSGAENGVDFDIEMRDDPAAGVSIFDGLKALKGSGLFSEIRAGAIKVFVTGYEEPGDNGALSQVKKTVVHYVNEAEYLLIFDQAPPVSYQDLAQQGGYIYTLPSSGSREEPDTLARLAEAETGRMKLYSEYLGQADGSEPELRPQEISVCALAGSRHYHGALVGTLDTYREIKDPYFGMSEARHAWASLSCGTVGEYSYEEYGKVKELFQTHSQLFSFDSDEMGNSYGDYYKRILAVQITMAAIRMGVWCFDLLIAVAALVNLVNIISTGIADRRKELACLQCVGMTEGQLLRLSMLECLQYVMTSMVSSAVIIGAALAGVYRIVSWLYEELTLEEVTDYSGDFAMDLMKGLKDFDYLAPFVQMLLAGGIAFAVGLAAAQVVLRMQDRRSLADRIRGGGL